MNIYRGIAVLTLLILVATVPTVAGITATGGTTMLVANPSNMHYTADYYNIDRVFFWPERTAQVLASELVVSILPPLSFPTDSTSHSFDNTLTVANGTTIDSYFLVYDPSGGATVASFKFDDPIVGLITNSRDSDANDHFMLSDYLIDPLVPAANIPTTHYDARGIEPANGDYIRWLSATEIELHIGASIPGDHIRVITSPVPEPASALLLGLGLAATVRFGSRKMA